MSGALVTIEGLTVRWEGGAAHPGAVAVDGVTLEIRQSEILGLVGESGSGKTSLACALLGLVAPRAGRISFEGEEITSRSERAWRPMRRRIQMVFQDAESALDPRWTIGQSVAEGLAIQAIGTATERRERVEGALRRVGLPEDTARQQPYELSGGQRQRAGIARALVLEPTLLVADEITSALDATVKLQILDLLGELREGGLTCLYITHDLREAAYLADRVAVMHQGRIVEVGPAREVLEHPQAAYTQALVGGP
jgi:ABC-type glutathione transport system ATPase component